MTGFDGGARPAAPRWALLLAAAALSGLAGCSSGGDAAAPRAASVAGEASAASPDQDAAGPTPAASPPPGNEAAAPVLVLAGDGLGLLAADDSEAPLPFGSTSADAVREVVEDAFGPAELVPVPGCPQGPRTALRVDGFTVLLDGDRFVGWTDVGAPDRSVTTAAGVGPGSRLEDVQSAQAAVVAQDPAGRTTFATPDGLSGTLTGPDPGAVVSALSAGQTCPGS